MPPRTEPADLPASRTIKPSAKRSAANASSGSKPGVTSLPVARVQRIVKADRDIQKVNKEAIFAISVVTVSQT